MPTNYASTLPGLVLCDSERTPSRKCVTVIGTTDAGMAEYAALDYFGETLASCFGTSVDPNHTHNALRVTIYTD